MIDKTVASFDAAVGDMQPGMTVLFGGFATPHNIPSYLIAAVARLGVSDLTAVATAGGQGSRARDIGALKSPLVVWPEDGFDLGLLVELRRLRRLITSFPVGNRAAMVYPFEDLLREGLAEVEVQGQGSLAERIRAARAGIAAFYTPVGPGTFVAEGKEVRDFDGVPHVLERALPADFALIRAHRADRLGNLVMRGPRTFNQTMAGAAKVTVAEVEEVAETGALDPNEIHVPGVYVQRVVQRPSRGVTSWQEPC